MATIKNCYSPGGMHFTTGNLRHTNLTDCPGCKHGTLDPHPEIEHAMKCADCGREYTRKQLTEMRVLSNADFRHPATHD